MKLWAAALAMTAFMVGPAHAQFSLPESMPEMAKGAQICNKGGTVCLVNKADLDAVIAEIRVQFITAEIMGRVAKQKEAELEALREKCVAKLVPLPRGGKS